MTARHGNPDGVFREPSLLAFGPTRKDQVMDKKIILITGGISGIGRAL